MVPHIFLKLLNPQKYLHMDWVLAKDYIFLVWHLILDITTIILGKKILEMKFYLIKLIQYLMQQIGLKSNLIILLQLKTATLSKNRSV